MFIFGLVLFAFLFSAFIYIGVSFWRVHKETFLRLSLYDLTQQTGLIANFGEHSATSLKALNTVAMDALSFNRLLKLFLAWPVYAIRFRQALNFAAYSSRLLGDEKTESLKQSLLEQGFPQADVADQKSKEHFQEGFLIRRLDEDLVSVFWHSPNQSGQGSISDKSPNSLLNSGKVLQFRVPTHVRMQRLQAFLARKTGSPYWAQGQAQGQALLPYVVVYEPFSFGSPFKLKDALEVLKKDLGALRNKIIGPNQRKHMPFTPDFGPDLRAEKAFARFLKSTQRNAFQRPSETQE